MMCESVGEFDENVPLPTPQEDVNTVMAPMAEHIDDPVSKTIAELSVIYERSVVPMLSMDQNYGDDPEESMHKLETISTGIGDIANGTRKMVGKLHGLLQLLGTSDSDYTTLSFATHLGYFMKNAQTVKRQGIEYYEYSYDAIAAFQDFWRINNMITAISKSPEIMDTILGSTMLGALLGSNNDKISSTFESTIDLLRCIYTDPDRMARLECSNTRKLSFDNLVECRRYCEPVCQVGDSVKVCREFCWMLSTDLRVICRQCYDMQSLIVDGEMDAGEFTRNISKLLARSVNLFALGTMMAMTMATTLREVVAQKNAVDAYTKLLLDTLKTV